MLDTDQGAFAAPGAPDDECRGAIGPQLARVGEPRGAEAVAAPARRAVERLPVRRFTRDAAELAELFDEAFALRGDEAIEVVGRHGRAVWRELAALDHVSRVESVAQAVPDEIDRYDREENRKTREYGSPRRRCHVLRGVLEHVAPGGHRW